MVKFLIASGADVNIKTYSGVTPLMAAIYRENLDMVKYLISQKALINAKDAKGETPLMYAVNSYSGKIAIQKLGGQSQSGKRDLEIIQFLISKGADVNSRDEEGVSVLQKALGEAEKILKAHGAK